MTDFPNEIGKCLSQLNTIKRQIALVEARLEPLKKRETAMREHLLTNFKKTELNGAKGSGLSVAVVHTTSPKVADWDKFFTFVKKAGNDDLLNRAVNAAAWRERTEHGKAVPGVEPFNNVILRVTRIGIKEPKTNE